MASLALSLLLISSLAIAAPKSRSSKLKFQEISSRYGARGYSATCKESEPCGWALYTPGSSPRKIYKYTRNIFCGCEGVECAASQGTPFSSTLSSSTADLRRLQSLGFPIEERTENCCTIFVSEIIIANK